MMLLCLSEGGYTILEKDLYPAIKQYFENLNYEVKAEVIDTDIIAKKDGKLTAIEMKTCLSMKVFYQALNRKGITSDVYIAVPKTKIPSKDLRYLFHILRRLELGLLFVHKNGYVECFTEPMKCTINPISVSSRRAAYHSKEFDGRSIDGNVAGSCNTKRLTAYREKAIRVACVMIKHGVVSPKRLRDEFGMDNTITALLRNNFYGWFYRKSRGIYGITCKGREEITEFQELVDFINQELEE